ncbi:MAG TPA: sulfite exporter TauE/SafE family protein [Dissulfurispiraceae bacterium]|nr:sulfite exporter TauE/SafE family protein [Dissulfurispiraceae bacterium]
MQHDLWLSLFGFIVGLFGTLIGAGGGFILTPVLLLLYPHDSPDTITSISLSVTFANAFSGSMAYARMGRIDYKYGLIFAGAAIPGAVLGAISTYYVPRRTFDLIFAILLAAISIIIFFKTPSGRASHSGNAMVLSFRDLRIGITISLLVGFVSSFLGIGGGIIHVPALAGILGFPVHVATATSHFILAIVTFVGVAVHVITGTFHHGVTRAIFLALGVILGAQAGALLSSKVEGKVIIRALSVALALVAMRLLFLSLKGY